VKLESLKRGLEFKLKVYCGGVKKFLSITTSARSETELLRDRAQMSGAKEAIILNSEHPCQRCVRCIPT
jgi:hypothetical protein